MFDDKFIICLIILLAFICGCIYGSKKQSKVAAEMTLEVLEKTLKEIYYNDKDVKYFLRTFIKNARQMK